ncbi:MAG: hypothetical protein ACI398_05280 [Clostridium sp.]
MKLVKINREIWFKNSFILAIFLMVFTPMLFYIKNTDVNTAATICDTYFSLFGFIFMVSIFLPEEKENVLELINCRTINSRIVYLIRLVIAIIASLFFISVSIYILKLLGGNFPIEKYIYGSFSTAMYLGAIGLFVASITGESILGYLAAISYVLAEYVAKGDYINDIYIYSMTKGEFYQKKYLITAAVILLILSICIKQIKSKR